MLNEAGTTPSTPGSLIQSRCIISELGFRIITVCFRLTWTGYSYHLLYIYLYHHIATLHQMKLLREALSQHCTQLDVDCVVTLKWICVGQFCVIYEYYSSLSPNHTVDGCFWLTTFKLASRFSCSLAPAELTQLRRTMLSYADASKWINSATCWI